MAALEFKAGLSLWCAQPMATSFIHLFTGSTCMGTVPVEVRGQLVRVELLLLNIYLFILCIVSTL